MNAAAAAAAVAVGICPRPRYCWSSSATASAAFTMAAVLVLTTAAASASAWTVTRTCAATPTTTGAAFSLSLKATRGRPSSRLLSLRAATTSSTTSATTTASVDSVRLNPLLSSIEPSATVQIFSQVQELQSKGVQVTSLCVGEPDFAPPPCVNQAVIDALSGAADTSTKYTRYTAVKGTLALRTAIADDLAKRKGLEYNPNTEIIVSSGAKPSVFGAIWAVAGGTGGGTEASAATTQDAVLIPAPYWTSYPEQVKLTGSVPIIVDTTVETGYKLTPMQLRETLQQYESDSSGHAIRALILCHPSNPTGSVYTKAELEQLCAVLYDYPDVTVISDEIYERLVYDDVEHVAVASLPNMRHRTITLNGVSKSHAMTGYRIGYAAAPKPYIDAMTTIQSQLASCACAISQHAAAVALTSTPDEWMTDVVNVMQTKRNYVVSRLFNIPNLGDEVSSPVGAFYVLADISAYLQSSLLSSPYATDTDFCLALLEEQRLAVVPGSAFGAPGTIRLSYATDMDTLQTALDKLETFLDATSQQQVLVN